MHKKVLNKPLFFLFCLFLLYCNKEFNPISIETIDIAVPNSYTIAYVTNDEPYRGECIRIIHDSREPFRLTKGGYEMQPDWSPDKQWIVFTRILKGATFYRQVWKMKYNGKQKQPLSPENIDCASPHFSPDGQKIIFAATIKSDHIPQLVMVDTDGTNWQQITHSSIVQPWSNVGFVFSSWSPDGKKIVAFHYNADNPRVNGVGILDLETGNFTEMTSITELQPWQPDWSPLRDEIVFVSGANGAGAYIYRVNVDGTGLVKLTSEIDCWEPNWSPDGQKIVYSKINPDTRKSEIWTMNRDGSDKQKILSHQYYDYMQPVW